MDPVTIGAMMVPTVLQGAKAIQQNVLAKNLKKSNYIPPGMTEAEAMARAASNATQAPGQSVAEDKVDQQTANTTAAVRTAAKDSSTVLDKVQQADAISKSKKNDINAKAQEFKYRNQKSLEGTLKQKAQYQQNNENQYNAAKSALRGASDVNAFNAAQNLGTAAIMMGYDQPQGTTPPPATTATTTAPKKTVTPDQMTAEQLVSPWGNLFFGM